MRKYFFDLLLKGYIGIIVLIPYRAFAQVDVTAPLQQLQSARDKAKSSNLQVSQIKTGSESLFDIILIIAGVCGTALTGVSLYKLYQASQDEQSREHVGRSVAGIVIGAIITMLAVVVGLITTTATGGN
ncbi:hypothetical protein [Microvirga puerhi]|uniref:DUF4134 domain-containing protein n=1 Tax=Microvirga puerhi TaxID=2876078 RepID=A0ABS7VV59_9HYPH|nr:hypothetical protein [Microvirga puerhi]MBZ6078945.1 hypothetical protein [Microvirga puerhi]